jgi:hypothetical protein
VTDTGTGDIGARLRKWFDSTRDDLEREAPEVLEGMAADARKLAQFLEEKASAVRRKQATDVPEVAEQTEQSAPQSDPPSAG